MKDKGVLKKGDKLVRKPTRQRGNTDIRPFKAPRQVTKGIDSNSNTEVQAITETTGSTPEMLKSPDISQDKVPGFVVENHPEMEPTVVAQTVKPRKYKGWVYIDEKIPETEDS